MDVRRPGASEAERRRWFEFLMTEFRRPDGLLCFYDREKSPQVQSSCRLLARHLTTRMSPPPLPSRDPDREDEVCPFSLSALPEGPG